MAEPAAVLWSEHGWALSGRYAVALVGLIVLLSWAVSALE